MASRLPLRNGQLPCLLPNNWLTAQPSQSARVAPFSTSSQLSYPAPPKKKGGEALAHKGVKQLKLTKKRKPIENVKKPAVGERKALKRRIVLSNTNALPVEGLRQLDKTSLGSKEVLGQVVALSDSSVDQLRHVEAFKTTQGWKHFRHPSMIMTRESYEILSDMAEIDDALETPPTTRKVVIGQKASGKSMLVLQSLAAAFIKGWIVINIPEAKDLVYPNTEYGPLPGTDPPQIVQRTYMANLLKQMEAANERIFSTMTITQDPGLPIPLEKDTTLTRLCRLGQTNPEISWQVFQAVWTEITRSNSLTPPIIFAIDGLDYIMRPTGYVDPNMKNIHAHDLAIVSHFLSYLSGSKSLPNGGLVLAATTESHSPPNPAMSHSLEAAEARRKGDEDPYLDPYRRGDARVLEALESVDVIRMTGLSKGEARNLLNYYAASGTLRHLVDERFVGDNWTLSGGGIVGELERAAVVMGAGRI